jgi:hypothetical protein
MAPCGTLIVVHDTVRETWKRGTPSTYYLGPSFHHYRNYRCLITHTLTLYARPDSIILYPAPLVLIPGANCFDKLLSLTENLVNTASDATLPNNPDLQQQYRDCMHKLKTSSLQTPQSPSHHPLP